MEEKVVLDSTLIKLKKNHYDLTKLTPEEIENMKENAPADHLKQSSII